MEEQSFHEKEGLADSSAVHRLSESRPKFKPVLVKKLLADESDDDSEDSDNEAPNSDNSDEESDNIDGCQPLPEDCANNGVSSSFVSKTNVELSVAAKKDHVPEILASGKISSEVVSIKIEENIELDTGSTSENNAERRSISNTLLKDPLIFSDYAAKKSEEDKLASGSKRKSSKDLVDVQNSILSQWQPQTTLDKRKSSPVKDSQEPTVKSKYSPHSKRLSHNTAVSFINETKDKPATQFESYTDLKETQEPRRYSSTSTGKSHCINSDISDDKISGSSKIPVDQSRNTKTNAAHSTLNTTRGIMDTPMKHPQESSRPNPCTSHRNIFQTPQNKIGNEFAKNPLQTPATIFSHWSQNHMAQTPMQNQILASREPIQTPATRESMQTPATACVQSQSTRVERPRYYSVEGKNVRRPLAETMFSAPVQGSQLPRLQETPHEIQSNLPITKDSSNALIHETVSDKKPVYTSSSHLPYEIKENKNPNKHDFVKSESHPGYHPPFKSEVHVNEQPMSKSRLSFSSQPDVKPKLDYQHNVYSTNSNVSSSRSRESYDNYKSRESQSVHPPAPVQSEQQIPPLVQYAKPQQTNLYNSKQKIITVQGQQYLFLSVIGQGMSCEVVRAQDLSNLDLRAIKCVNLNKMDKESVQGCLQEICMLDKLKAPCVVHMYSFEVKQPWVHVVMEIGDTDLNRLLKSMLAEKKKLPLTMILYYWTEMLTAVRHIHDNGVIHSDLKPANFLLVRGRLKLIDFGIASSINSDMTSVLKNCSIGTLNYISPEALMDVNAGSDSPNQNVKYKISYKSDVWSLGCILYSLVYGSTPFNHIRQQWGKISAITDPKHKINFPLVSGNEPVPLILIDVMRKCLQREPKARPAVADLLEIPYLQGNVTPAIVPNIPSNILLKIKHALSDEEWKQFSESLSKR